MWYSQAFLEELDKAMLRAGHDEQTSRDNSRAIRHLVVRFAADQYFYEAEWNAYERDLPSGEIEAQRFFESRHSALMAESEAQISEAEEKWGLSPHSMRLAVRFLCAYWQQSPIFGMQIFDHLENLERVSAQN